jgi:outer membrane immunogenic protein
MKKFVFALTLVSALVQPFTTASAADFEPPPPPTDDLRPATYDWSGLYAGASLGAMCVEEEGAESLGCNYDLIGFGGYNFQADKLVFGLEGELGFAGDHSATDVSYDHGMNAGIRGRMGFAHDNTLFYGVAGYHMAKSNVGIYYSIPAPAYWSYDEKTRYSWSVGAGIEHAITDVLRIRAEYVYSDLKANTCGGCGLTSQSVRIGMAYAF